MNLPRPQTFDELVGFKLPPALPAHLETHGTTVLSLRCKEGVLTLADRRATMGNLIMYDHAEKIVALDDSTVVAISGSFARAIEVCRLLRHTFKYYSRLHLQEMSLEGKLQEISRVIAGNMPGALEGIGLFIPILSAYDSRTGQFSIYFFDAAGARFQNASYACAGSGSERIRGVFEYLVRSEKPWDERPMKDVLVDGLHMLDIAADLDSATGGFTKVLPAARLLTAESNELVPENEIADAAKKVLAK